MKKALVIFNPTAGVTSKIDVKKLVIDKLVDDGFNVDLFYLNAGFEKNIIGYKFNNVSLVVAIGGDGTVKVATRTILSNDLKTPLVIIPYGSANVIAASLGIPFSAKKSLALINSKKTTSVDVGIINNKQYFLVGFSIGYVSSVVTSASRKIKNKFGFLGYIINFIFNKIKIRRIKFKIKIKKRTFWVKGNSLIIFNALNYFGLKPKKPIDFQDGLLNLYIFTNRSFFALFEAVFYMVWYQKPPRYVFTLDDSHFRIFLSRRARNCQLDGDKIKLPKILDVRVLEKALKIIVPK